jgi:hypothetical protein
MDRAELGFLPLKSVEIRLVKNLNKVRGKVT